MGGLSCITFQSVCTCYRPSTYLESSGRHNCLFIKKCGQTYCTAGDNAQRPRPHQQRFANCKLEIGCPNLRVQSFGTSQTVPLESATRRDNAKSSNPVRRDASRMSMSTRRRQPRPTSGCECTERPYQGSVDLSNQPPTKGQFVTRVVRLPFPVQNILGV